MFQKKQIIYSESIGLCVVDNIVNLTASKNTTAVAYYLLKSVFDEDKVAYIPVENHQVKLRELFTEEEAGKLAQCDQVKKDDNLKKAVEYVLGQQLQFT